MRQPIHTPRTYIRLMCAAVSYRGDFDWFFINKSKVVAVIRLPLQRFSQKSTSLRDPLNPLLMQKYAEKLKENWLLQTTVPLPQRRDSALTPL